QNRQRKLDSRANRVPFDGCAADAVLSLRNARGNLPGQRPHWPWRCGLRATMGGAPGTPSSLPSAPSRRQIMLVKCLKKVFRNRRPRRSRCSGANSSERLRWRPALEPLEDRATPSVSGPPFDFSNAFYLANGIDPSKILNRVGSANSASAFVAENSSPDANHDNIRITEMTGGFK